MSVAYVSMNVEVQGVKAYIDMTNWHKICLCINTYQVGSVDQIISYLQPFILHRVPSYKRL